MRRPTPVFAALLVACATALAACAPTSPTTSPSYGHKCPGPTPGAPERTCSAAEYEQSERRAALVRDAKQVYEELTAERFRLMREGGALEASPVLKERATGEYLENIVGLLKFQKERGDRRTGSVSVSSAEEIPAGADAVVALATCDDGRSIEVFDQTGQLIDRGVLVASTSYFTMSEGRLKVFRGTAKKVDQCPA